MQPDADDSDMIVCFVCECELDVIWSDRLPSSREPEERYMI